MSKPETIEDLNDSRVASAVALFAGLVEDHLEEVEDDEREVDLLDLAELSTHAGLLLRCVQTHTVVDRTRSVIADSKHAGELTSYLLEAAVEALCDLNLYPDWHSLWSADEALAACEFLACADHPVLVTGVEGIALQVRKDPKRWAAYATMATAVLERQSPPFPSPAHYMWATIEGTTLATAVARQLGEE
ncbi:MAG: hypothetical protein P1V36_01720 [Planctomycetota bacterium]|nr:hypothetical protein [Planctomycetota bacterium]